MSDHLKKHGYNTPGQLVGGVIGSFIGMALVGASYATGVLIVADLWGAV